MQREGIASQVKCSALSGLMGQHMKLTRWLIHGAASGWMAYVHGKPKHAA